MVPGSHPIEALTLTLAERIQDRSINTIREDLLEPGPRGLHQLAAYITNPKKTKVVLVIDQLEELFTQTSDEKEREQFIDLLVTACTEQGGPVFVILTLRADFSDRPMHYPVFGKLLEKRKITVSPMEAQELRDVIEKPAALSGVQLTFEDNLVKNLLFDFKEQIGALPL